MISEKKGSCRPTIADSARVVVCVSLAEHRRQQAAERRDRDAERPECDRRGVGDQREHGGHDRLEAEAREHRGGDRDRRAEAGNAFDQRAEAEGDEQDLDAAIGRQPRQRSADDVEVAALDREVVEQHRR